MDTDPSSIRQDKLSRFNPDNNGNHHNGIFGLPFDPNESQVILIPVPWDATVSYGEGAANGPDTIWKASQQIDLHNELRPGTWKAGYAMTPIKKDWYQKSKQCREQVKAFLAGNSNRKKVSIDENCNQLNKAVEEEALNYLKQDKIVGLVGGEHSVILGYLRALKKFRQKPASVLQIDAHCDLRPAYEKLHYSHASVFYNSLQEGLIDQLVPLAIRDYAESEAEFMASRPDQIIPFSDTFLKQSLLQGVTWHSLCEQVIQQLPSEVYVTLDIDGLNPALCPNTGTPVPGGLSFDQVIYLLHRVTASGRQIIGFDLCEVAPGSHQNDEWDGNVGARLLYQLCNETVYSQKGHQPSYS